MAESDGQAWPRVVRFRRVAEEFAEWSGAELERLASTEAVDLDLYRRARELVLRKLGAEVGGGR
jgi:hypothetical protein